MQLSAINIEVHVRGFKNFQELLTMERKKYDTEEKNKDHFPCILDRITL